MRSRLPVVLAAFLMIVVVYGVSVANAWPASRLTALAARQELREEVLIAISLDGGVLSCGKRAIILQDAAKILDPMEFESFRRALDRIAPLPPPMPAVAHHNPMAYRSSNTLKRYQAWQLMARYKPISVPVMPAGATQPDRMASSGVVR